MAMPKVSVIVPVYNVEAYLRRCLDSLVAQTLSDIEIVCVNDGSPDGSAAILAEYAAKDSRVRVIDRENGGLSAARNTGIESASAPFLMFCDSDDWVEPDWCEALYAAVESGEADFAVARAFIDGDCPAKYRHALEKNQKLRLAPGLHEVVPGEFNDVDHAVWIRIFRRDVVERYGLRFPEGAICEDWPFTKSYLSVSRRFRLLDRKLYHYFQRSGSILNGGTKAARMEMDFFRNWGRTQEFMMANGVWPRWRGVMMADFAPICGKTAACNPDGRDSVYALADEFLSRLSPAEIEGLDAEARGGVRLVRNRNAHSLKTERWKFLGLTLVKVKTTLLDRKTYVLGLRVHTRRHA